MANPHHLDVLRRGVVAWNSWRYEHPRVRPDLTKANLSGNDLRKFNLYEANLFGANLDRAKLRKANLIKADIRSASLIIADLTETDLNDADFSNSTLTGADLSEADLTDAKLRNANIEGANLIGARLVRTNLEKANLTGCRVYGISAWHVELEGTHQTNLVITQNGESTITVDNLELAQFIYLLLNNRKIRDVIDSISTKVVLILGRFTPERKAVLDAVRDELRKRNLLPVLFDFDKPASRNLTETVSALAHMARYVIADITEARSIPQELQRIIPSLPSVPIQPLLQATEPEYGMFEDFRDYPWVLEIHRYNDVDDLLASLVEKVITPAEAKLLELKERREKS